VPIAGGFIGAASDYRGMEINVEVTVGDDRAELVPEPAVAVEPAVVNAEADLAAAA
jgi:hypothetical protein